MARRAEHAEGMAESDKGETGLSISLLGPLAVTRNGAPVEVTGPKRRALLTLLALHIGTPLGRDRIIEALWPSNQTGREDSTLRVHISHLRDELEPARRDEPVFLTTRGASYVLDGGAIELDVSRFDELTGEARALLVSEPDRARSLLDEALGLWRGRALQDVEYEDFAQDEIRRLEDARVEAVENRAEALMQLGEPGAAVEDLERLVRDDPTRERAVTLLMAALYRSGRQVDALRAARRHVRALAESGLEPSPRLAALEEKILRHDPELLPPGSISPDDIAPGRSVRGYELRDVAGSGSIGVVYRAFQPAVGREVAVKVVHPELAQTPEFVRRFADEARVIAAIQHPHIVPVHDFWREPAGAFLVMRWMDGGSLSDRMGEKWGDDELIRVFDQLADALAYAHSQGVVHRDVKPGNVLFDRSGNAYLCDFGLAATGIETTAESRHPVSTTQPSYLPPELRGDEGPTVAADIYGLGVLLAEAASGAEFSEGVHIGGDLEEVVRVATANNPADRYPDMSAFRLALRTSIGTTSVAAPRRVRRNPYKGLAPFDEGDSADFYGRDDVIESVIDVVARNGLTTIIGASGSGKSSLVMAGVVPTLRGGALPGSEEWSFVHMVPGVDPFEEFHIGLRSAAVTYPLMVEADSRELRRALAAALDGHNRAALVVVDQFEELFSSAVDPEVRERFLENLVDLASDPGGRYRVILTLRADFSDRPLADPTFGDLVSGGSVLLAPMRPEQVEEVIRRPAARVGIEVEPGLVSEIVRDISDAPAHLPLLQYVLAELFERRSEDRLTVHSYRALGGVQGVLQRQAEATYSSLDDGAKAASRQLFLRMVQLGELGEETRRRVSLTEIAGLGRRADVEAALDAFSAARLIAYDRDPVSRTPTVEVAHETVISRWTRYRVWIDDARTELLAHRRLSAAAETWAESGEDPAYLLTGGPLASAVEVLTNRRVAFNETESLFVDESRAAAEKAARLDSDRRIHEAELERRSKRRLAIGLVSVAVAMVVATLAVFAFVQRQRADELAAEQGRENRARELAAASIANLASADHDLSLVQAIAAAEQTLAADDGILPEAVDALHLAVINPRPDLIIDGALGDNDGEAISYSGDGNALAYVTDDGVVAVVDSDTGGEMLRTHYVDVPAEGVDIMPDGSRLMSIHRDGVREWATATEELIRWIPHPGVTTAAYSPDGGRVAVGDESGLIAVYEANRVVYRLEEGGHRDRIVSVDFDPSGSRLVSADNGNPGKVLVWDLASETVTQSGPIMTAFCVDESSWHPREDEIAVTLCHGEAFTFDANTGERVHAFASGNQRHFAIVYDTSGAIVAAAGLDGFTRLFGTGVGGASLVDLPNGGVPVEDVEFRPHGSGEFELGSLELATLGTDGRIRIWRDSLARSELAPLHTTLLYSFMEATPDGSRYIVGSNSHIYGLPQAAEILPPYYQVVDAASGEVLARYESFWHLGLRFKPAISDDGSLVAFAGASGNVVLAHAAGGVIGEIPGSARWALDLDFRSDGDMLAGGGPRGDVAVWDVSTLSLNRVMVPGLKPTAWQQRLLTGRSINEIEFVPESNEVVTVGADGSVRIWDPGNGTNRILDVFDFAVLAVDVSPDGSTVAAADLTGNVRLLDIEEGTLKTPSPRKVPGFLYIEFSPDGRFLAGGGPGPFVHLWSVDSGELIRRFEGAVGAPKVVFASGGTELRAVGAEGIVRGYVLDPMRLVDIARERLGREMTEDECREYLRHPCVEDG